MNPSWRARWRPAGGEIRSPRFCSCSAFLFFFLMFLSCTCMALQMSQAPAGQPSELLTCNAIRQSLFLFLLFSFRLEIQLSALVHLCFPKMWDRQSRCTHAGFIVPFLPFCVFLPKNERNEKERERGKYAVFIMSRAHSGPKVDTQNPSSRNFYWIPPPPLLFFDFWSRLSACLMSMRGNKRMRKKKIKARDRGEEKR